MTEKIILDSFDILLYLFFRKIYPTDAEPRLRALANIQLAVKNNEVENKYHFVYKDKSSVINNDTFKITPKFESGFFNLSSNLVYEII